MVLVFLRYIFFLFKCYLYIAGWCKVYAYGQFSRTIVVFFVPGAKHDHAGDTVGPYLFKESRKIKTTLKRGFLKIIAPVLRIKMFGAKYQNWRCLEICNLRPIQTQDSTWYFTINSILFKIMNCKFTRQNFSFHCYIYSFSYFN